MKKNLFAAIFTLISFSLFSQAENPDLSTEIENQIESQVEVQSQIENQDENQNPSIDTSLTITKINFIGLKKTRNSYIQSRVKKFVGKSIAETDLHELETVIQLEEIGRASCRERV